MADIDRSLPNAQVRGRTASEVLSRTARALNFETRSRRYFYHLVGLRPRFIDQLFFFLQIFSFVGIFLLPVVVGAVYFGFIMTPVYQSEARFVLRSSVPVLSRDRLSGNNGSVSAKIAQDTQIVANYFESPSFVTDIADQVNMVELYGRRDIDYFSRLTADPTLEDIQDYWEARIDATISPSSGIVTVWVEAFSPEEAKRLLEVVLGMAEARVNSLNEGIWSSLVSSAKNDVENARERLESVRVRVAEQQNRSGVFSVDQNAQLISQLINDIRDEILEMEGERRVLLNSLAAESPLITQLNASIQARERQIRTLEDGLAGQPIVGDTLSQNSLEFNQLQLETKIAESSFTRAVEELERVEFISSLQLVFIDQFTQPTLPQDPVAPKRSLIIPIIFGICFFVWILLVAVLKIAQNKVD